MADFITILPEIFLVFTLVAVLIGEITYHGEEVRLIFPVAITGLVMALIQAISVIQRAPVQIFNQALSVDGISIVFKVIFILLALISLIAARTSKEIPEERKSEFAALVLAFTLAMCLVASASDLILAFAAVQFMNLIAYFLSGYAKKSIQSTEAAVKYMAFSAVSATLLIYGFALLFGATHSMGMYEIHRALVSVPLSNPRMLVIFMLTFLGLCFQPAAFPMYLWAPDVVEGAPTPVSAFLSFGTRAAGFALALRFVIVVFAQPTLEVGQWEVLGGVDWTEIVALVSGLSMLIGSLLAFRQTGAKRMVGYLGVAESGFLMLGLLVLDEVGVAAILFNLIVQLFSMAGIYFILAFLYDEIGSDRLEDLNGMLKRAVPECICLLIFLYCLVGLPPTPGFIGKFTLIGVAVRHHRPILAAVAIAAMVLSSIAIARLGYHLVGDFRKPQARAIAPSAWRRIFLAGLALPMLLTGIFAETLLGLAGRALGFILW